MIEEDKKKLIELIHNDKDVQFEIYRVVKNIMSKDFKTFQEDTPHILETGLDECV